jgi:ATP-binding cassette subfamily B protein
MSNKVKNKKKDAVDKKVELRTLHYYFEMLKKYKWSALGSVIFAPLSEFLWGAIVPLFLASILDRVSRGNVTNEVIYNELLPQAVMCIVIGIISTIFSIISTRLLWRMEMYIKYDLNANSFKVISAQSMQFHSDRFSGSLVSMVEKFANAFERFWDTTIFNIIPFFTTITSTIVILIIKGVPIAAGVVALIVVLFMAIAYFTTRKMAEISKREATAHTKMIGQLSDSISNVMSVKSYANEKHELSRFKERMRNYVGVQMEQMNAFTSRKLMFNSISMLTNACILFFLITGSPWFGLSTGLLLIIYTYLRRVVDGLFNVSSIFRDLTRIFGDANDMTLALDAPDEVVDQPGAKDLKVKESKIEFRNIAFKHKDAKTEIFNDFNLSINAGERVGLVGVSGSGKSTITKLLLRFADVQKGEILVSDENIKCITQRSLRKNIAYVPQETTLFHRSIAENIAYGKPDATINDIKRAAKLANADKFIEDMPEGYETMVGERGVKLSGGQRQRIAIARAILKDAPILVLDEATSALDSESEALIQDALNKLMKNRT